MIVVYTVYYIHAYHFLFHPACFTQTIILSGPQHLCPGEEEVNIVCRIRSFFLEWLINGTEFIFFIHSDVVGRAVFREYPTTLFAILTNNTAGILESQLHITVPTGSSIVVECLDPSGFQETFHETVSIQFIGEYN